MNPIRENAQTLAEFMSSLNAVYDLLKNEDDPDIITPTDTQLSDEMHSFMLFAKPAAWGDDLPFRNQLGLFGSKTDAMRQDQLVATDTDNNISDLIETARNDGMAYLAINVAPDGKSENNANHWVPLVVKHENGEFIAHYFNFKPGYAKISETLRQRLQNYGKENDLQIKFDVFNRSIQKDTYNCAHFTDLYFYLCSLKQRAAQANYQETASDKIFKELVSEQMFDDVKNALTDVDNHSVISDTMSKLVERKPQLPNQIRQLTLVNMSRKILEEASPEEVEKCITVLIDVIDKLLEDTTDAEKILLAASLLGIATGFYVHIKLLSGAAGIGSAIFGFRVGQKELQIRALYQKKNELLASQAENQETASDKTFKNNKLLFPKANTKKTASDEIFKKPVEKMFDDVKNALKTACDEIFKELVSEKMLDDIKNTLTGGNSHNEISDTMSKLVEQKPQLPNLIQKLTLDNMSREILDEVSREEVEQCITALVNVINELAGNCNRAVCTH